VWGRRTTTGLVRVLVSRRAHGDFNLDLVATDVLERRRRALVDLPWTMLDEHHGTDVVRVGAPGEGDRRAVAAGTCCAVSEVTASTRWGTMSLDAPAAIRAVLGRHGVALRGERRCTGCDESYFSHRMRGESQRQIVAVWKEAA
jgi:hypothetical protein